MSSARRSLWKLGPDRGLLRRPIDRVDSWATLLLAVTTLLAGPALAWWAADTAYHLGIRAERVERVGHYHVSATVTGTPSGLLATTSPYLVLSVADATWRAPDGGSREGVLTVPADVAAGSTVRIWTDRHGTLVSTPQSHDRTLGAAATAAMLVGCGLAGLAAGVHAELGRRFDRRRYDRWEQEWARLQANPRR